MRSSFINFINNSFSQQPVSPKGFQNIDALILSAFKSSNTKSVTSDFHSCIGNINTTIDLLVSTLNSADEPSEPFLRDILIIPLLNKVTEKLYVLSDYVTEQGNDHLENKVSSCLGIVQNICTILKRNNIDLNDQNVEISHHLYNLNIEFETFTQIVEILEQKNFENFDLSEDIVHDFHVALKNLSQTILDRCHSHKELMKTSNSNVNFV